MPLLHKMRALDHPWLRGRYWVANDTERMEIRENLRRIRLHQKQTKASQEGEEEEEEEDPIEAIRTTASALEDIIFEEGMYGVYRIHDAPEFEVEEYISPPHLPLPPFPANSLAEEEGDHRVHVTKTCAGLLGLLRMDDVCALLDGPVGHIEENVREEVELVME